MPRDRRFRFTLLVLGALPLAGCAGGPPDYLGVHDGSLSGCPPSLSCVHTGLRHPEGTKGIFVRSGHIARRDILPSVADILDAMPRTKLVEQRPEYLRAEARNTIFGFIDDVEVMLTADREIIVRSQRRGHRLDLGSNIARVEKLRQALDEAGVLK